LQYEIGPSNISLKPSSFYPITLFNLVVPTCSVW